MQNKTFGATHIRHVQFLKKRISAIDSMLHGLGHALGADIHALESSLGRKNGRIPNHHAAQNHRPAPPSTEDSIFAGLRAGLRPEKVLATVFNTGAYRSSRGQLWAGIASGIARALNRNL